MSVREWVLCGVVTTLFASCAIQIPLGPRSVWFARPIASGIVNSAAEIPMTIGTSMSPAP